MIKIKGGFVMLMVNVSDNFFQIEKIINNQNNLDKKVENGNNENIKSNKSNEKKLDTD